MLSDLRKPESTSSPGRRVRKESSGHSEIRAVFGFRSDSSVGSVSGERKGFRSEFCSFFGLPSFPDPAMVFRCCDYCSVFAAWTKAVAAMVCTDGGSHLPCPPKRLSLGFRSLVVEGSLFSSAQVSNSLRSGSYRGWERFGAGRALPHRFGGVRVGMGLEPERDCYPDGDGPFTKCGDFS